VNELGSLEDVIDITKRTTGTEPILNWAHIHARGAGILRTEQDFRSILDKVRASLGQSWLGNAYFIFSASSYGPSGEIKQIPLSSSDLNLAYLIKQIMSLGIKGTMIFDDPGREKAILDILTELGDMVR
jgi:deoxyribonuclease-4